MDRRRFIQNLLGATAAVAIGKYIAPITAISDYYTPDDDIVSTKVGDTMVWMRKQEYEFQKKWIKDQEKAYWFGKYKN